MEQQLLRRDQVGLSVVIQAGGNSSRMGENKYLKPFLGVPLLERVYHRVKTIADEIIIVCNEHQVLDFIGLTVVPDSLPGRGAIGGLYTAMDVAANAFVAVVACDLPFVSASILHKGFELLLDGNADVAVPKTNGEYYEPLHAVYRKETCRQAIQAAIKKEQRRLISWFPSVQVLEMDEKLCWELDPSRLAFININTPEDFAKAESLARS